MLEELLLEMSAPSRCRHLQARHEEESPRLSLHPVEGKEKKVSGIRSKWKK